MMPLPPGFTIDSAPPQPSSGEGGKLPEGFTIDEQKPKERTLASVPGEAIRNAVPSAIQFGKDLARPFIHPVDTARDLKNLGLGVLEKSGLKSPAGHEKYAEAVGQFLVDRYGGWENIKKTMATDPVGFASDASMLLTGGAGAARAVGAGGRVADVASATGRAIDPVNAAIRTAKPAISGAQGTLRDAGVAMTPGQMMGGVGKTIEDYATSAPIIRDFVNHGRAQSIESFNLAVGNQALEPIGESISRGTKAGHDALTEVNTKLGRAYDALLPQLKFVPDQQLRTDYQRILRDDVSILPKAYQDQFSNIIKNRVNIAPNGMNGQQFKNMESQLSHIANQHRSGSPADRMLADALDNVQKAAREALERSNPAHAGELQKINQGWAMFSRMRDAAVRRGTSAAVFTPSDLLQGIKKSTSQGSFARGEGLMQAFGEAAQKVLPSKMPDSGTAGRLAGMAAAGGLGTYLGHPATMAGMAAGAGLYTRPGMKAFNAYMDPRTKAHRAIRHPSVPAAGQAAFQEGRAGRISDAQGEPHDPLRITVNPLAQGNGP